jgi:carbon storage regulator
MLVLTRKTDQRIQIGHGITVTILRIKGNSVKIGVEAPDGTRILRSELVAETPPQIDSPKRQAPHPGDVPQACFSTCVEQASLSHKEVASALAS